MAQAGCPDPRNRPSALRLLCPRQPSHHAGWPARSCSGRHRDRFLVSFPSGHHGPHHSRDLLASAIAATLVGRRSISRAAKADVGAVILGVADDGHGAGYEQTSQVAITLLGDAAELVLAPGRMLPGHQPNPGEQGCAPIGTPSGRRSRQPGRWPRSGRCQGSPPGDGSPRTRDARPRCPCRLT